MKYIKKLGKNKKILVTVCTVLTIIVVFLLFLMIGNRKESDSKYQFREGEDSSEYSFVLEETHYIDQSLINIPISIPYEIKPNANEEVEWLSSDNSIVMINDDNTVTALQTGNVVLTLILKNNPNINASINIVVE